MEHQTFHYNTLDALQQEMNTVGVSLPLSTELERLQKPLTVQGKRFANSMAIQPMEGCDGTRDGRPDTLTERRYERFAKSGVGLIWVEAVAVVQEGRANPRQLFMNEKTLDSFKRLVQMIKETCLQEHGFEPVVIMQATHSGRYSKPNGKPEPIIAYQNPIFEKDTPIS
ncbi:MAG: flavin oxidoreductase/NADH oxidase, partial [Clostridia bacterium]